ncbi:MAG: hypothetical protein KF690_06745 [Bacteroidetes bacterium]|nr:hypothetical protein [Bacteroidota bacterium]
MRLRFPALLFLLPLAFLSCTDDLSLPEDEPTDGLPQVKLDIKRYELMMQEVSEGMDKGGDCRKLAQERFGDKEALIFSNWMMRGLVPPEAIDSLFRANHAKAERDMVTDICFIAENAANRMLVDSLVARRPADWPLEARLTPMFRRFRHFFPDHKIPLIRTAVAGHDPRMGPEDFYPADEVLLSQDWLFIGLDYFAGSDFTILHPGIPRYIRKRFDDQYLEVRIARALTPMVQPDLPRTPDPNLLAFMLHEGMKYYFIERLLPHVPDSTRMLWSGAQLAWAEKNEAAVYKLILGDLYASKYSHISYLLEERPFAKPGWDRNAPPRLGHYIGWRIIRKYMESHPQVQLRDLLRRTDWQRILQESGYKPVEPS